MPRLGWRAAATSAFTCAPVGLKLRLEHLAEIGRQLLDAGVGGGVGLRLIAVDAAGVLVGVDERDEADEHRRHEHQDEDRREQGDPGFRTAFHG